jgi:hypothetical protein
MDGIKIDVTGNIAKVTEKPRRITSGTIGLPVEFTFDDQWDGLSKKAVFRTGHFSIVCDLNEEGNTVPWEVLVFPNMWLSIGVYGVNEGGTVSIPTIWVNVSVIQPGTVPDGASPAEPTPPVWQRIEDEVNRIGGVVDQVNEEYAETKEKCDKTKAQVDQLEKNITPLIVTANSSMDKANHNFEEIRNHVLAGGDAFLDTFMGHITLNDLSYGEGIAIFSKVVRNGITNYVIDNEGNLELQRANLVTTAELGKLDVALAEILEYAKSLTSGGES